MQAAQDDVAGDESTGLTSLRADVLAGRTPGTQAVILGVAGRTLGLGRRETVLLLLHLHVAGCLGAALRLLDVDDVEMQRVRLELAPTLGAAADAALAIPWKEMYACAPQTELMTMLHERATVRLFAT
jgi:urease accessory protein